MMADVHTLEEDQAHKNTGAASEQTTEDTGGSASDSTMVPAEDTTEEDNVGGDSNDATPSTPTQEQSQELSDSTMAPAEDAPQDDTAAAGNSTGTAAPPATPHEKSQAKLDSVKLATQPLEHKLDRFAKQVSELGSKLCFHVWLHKALKGRSGSRELARQPDNLDYRIGVAGEDLLRQLFELDTVHGNDHIRAQRKALVKHVESLIARADKLRLRIKHMRRLQSAYKAFVPDSPATPPDQGKAVPVATKQPADAVSADAMEAADTSLDAQEEQREALHQEQPKRTVPAAASAPKSAAPTSRAASLPLVRPRMSERVTSRALELSVELPGLDRDSLEVHLDPKTRRLSMRGVLTRKEVVGAVDLMWGSALPRRQLRSVPVARFDETVELPNGVVADPRFVGVQYDRRRQSLVLNIPRRLQRQHTPRCGTFAPSFHSQQSPMFTPFMF